MSHKSKDSSLKRRIIHLQNAIRRKYRAFKLGNTYNEQLLEKQYKPILSELRKQTEYEVKTEPKDEPMEVPKEESMEEPMNQSEEEEESVKPVYTSTPKGPQFINDTEVYESPLPSVSQLIQSPSELHEASQYVKRSFDAPLTQRFMLKFLKNEAGVKNKIDNIFGPRYESDRLMIGNKPLTFTEEGNIRVNDIEYRGTEGLYELVFKRQPDETLYTPEDLLAYKDLLIKSNAHKKGYLPNNHINRPPTSIKYKVIIANLFPKTLYGKGLKDVGSRDISYWDDPNELVDRLKILVGSTEVGNNNHKNEIQNIIEELKEAKLISGAGNSRYKSFIV